jgi:hypothetical protein
MQTETNQNIREETPQQSKTEMDNVQGFSPDDIRELPKNTQVEGVITGMKLVPAKEVFGDKAKEPDRTVVLISYENAEHGIVGTQSVNYYPPGKIPEASKLGKLVSRYDGVKPGTKVTIDIDQEGHHGILV